MVRMLLHRLCSGTGEGACRLQSRTLTFPFRRQEGNSSRSSRFVPGQIANSVLRSSILRGFVADSGRLRPTVAGSVTAVPEITRIGDSLLLLHESLLQLVAMKSCEPTNELDVSTAMSRRQKLKDALHGCCRIETSMEPFLRLPPHSKLRFLGSSGICSATRGEIESWPEFSP